MLEQGFAGGVFSESLEGGRAGARVELSAQCVRATTTAGGEVFEIPYSACKLERGGASGKMVFCRGEGGELCIFSEAKGFEQALRRSGRAWLEPAFAEISRRASAQRRRATLGSAVVILLVVAIVVAAPPLLRAGARAAVGALPFSVDVAVGGAVFDDMTRAALDDPKVEAATKALIGRLAPHAAIEGVDFRLRVVRDKRVNAFALPGGFMVVYTGLLERAEAPEQVLGVLAHEMAHVTERHGMKRIAETAGVLIAVQILLGDATGLVELAAEVLTVAVLSSYSREAEAGADAEGARLLHAAGVDPMELASFFDLLARAEEEGPGADLQVGWLSSHPEHEERIAAIAALAKELGPVEARPVEIDWPALRQALAKPSPPGESAPLEDDDAGRDRR